MPSNNCAVGSQVLLHCNNSETNGCACTGSDVHAGAADVSLQAWYMVPWMHVRCEAQLLRCAGHSR